MENFLAAMIIAAMPFLFAALGELVTERSGVLNLGVEGMMLAGAVCAFIAAHETGSFMLGAVAGAVAGAAMAAIFALLALGFMANQAATGLALTIFGIGFSGLLGQHYVGLPLPKPAVLSIPGVTDSTMLGRVLLEHDALVWFGFLMAFAVWWFLARTRAGLKLRAAGDNPASAHALGMHVLGIRFWATLFGGAMAGLGGAYLSLAYTPMWGENMTAGRGWIALALVVFAAWRVDLTVIGALLFAAVTQLQFYAQDWGWPIASQFLAMGPYIATILALAVLARRQSMGVAPASLGIPFRPDR